MASILDMQNFIFYSGKVLQKSISRLKELSIFIGFESVYYNVSVSVMPSFAFYARIFRMKIINFIFSRKTFKT